MNVRKTIVLQKMGKEGRSYTMDYESANASVKALLTAFEEFARCGHRFTSAMEIFEASLASWSSALTDFAEHFQYNNPRLEKVWVYGTKLHSSLASNSQNIRESLIRCLDAIHSFISSEMVTAREGKALFRTAKIELDASEASIAALSNSSPSEVMRIVSVYVKCISKYDQLCRFLFSYFFLFFHLLGSCAKKRQKIRKRADGCLGKERLFNYYLDVFFHSRKRGLSQR